MISAWHLRKDERIVPRIDIVYLNVIVYGWTKI